MAEVCSVKSRVWGKVYGEHSCSPASRNTTRSLSAIRSAVLLFLEPKPNVDKLPVTTDVFRAFEFGHSERGGQRGQLANQANPKRGGGGYRVYENRERMGGPEHERSGARVLPSLALCRGRCSRAVSRKRTVRQEKETFGPSGSRGCFGSPTIIQPPTRDPKHTRRVPRPDFAEALSDFSPRGPASQRKGDVGTRCPFARVLPSRCHPDSAVRAKPAVKAILWTPKASFYPNYVEQSSKEPGASPSMSDGKPLYKTFMDRDAQIRGHKRYRSSEKVRSSDPGPEQERVVTEFCPLPAGDLPHIDPVPQCAAGRAWCRSVGVGLRSNREGEAHARPRPTAGIRERDHEVAQAMT